jgi:serine/threonine-protein kinase HipA
MKVVQNLTECFALMRRITKPSAPQLIRLLDCVIFNALIGNHDAHAKNFSASIFRPLSRDSSFLRYLIYRGIFKFNIYDAQMKIGSKYQFGEVQLSHWENFAEGIGLNNAQTKNVYWNLRTL